MQQLIRHLSTVLHTSYPRWRTGPLTPAGQGLEALVCRAESPVHGPMALKVPWVRTISNPNDEAVDARELLRQEAALADHLRPFGVPTPRMIALHLDDEVDFLASEFVAGDGSPPDPRAVGALVAAIHRAPAPAGPLIGNEGLRFSTLIARRLTQRVTNMQQLTGEAVRLPNEGELESRLGAVPERRSVLHMDIRPANLITREGQVAAVVDWSNGLIGDPALELARIAEYGAMSEAFLEGYGQSDPFGHLPAGVEVLYRLDTAVMLANVFLAEAPDPAAAERQVRRVKALAACL